MNVPGYNDLHLQETYNNSDRIYQTKETQLKKNRRERQVCSFTFILEYTFIYKYIHLCKKNIKGTKV